MNKCNICLSEKLVSEPRTKIISPNVYEHYDKIICKDCGTIKKMVLMVQDKNTENTKKLLTGNYIVNKSGNVVLKSKSKELKDLAEEVQEEIKVAELF